MNALDQGYRLALLALAWLACLVAPSLRAQTADQDTVKAALTFQVLSFTEWPADAEATPLIKIGVFEDPRLLAAFEELLSRPSYRGRYAISSINRATPRAELKDLHALFFARPEPREIPHLIKSLESLPVVLIGSFDGFLESGGMVNLIKKNKKLAFEIDVAASQERGIEYRSKLLRLASRIIER